MIEFNIVKTKITFIIVLLICSNFFIGSEILSLIILVLCLFLVSEPLNLFSIYYITSIGSRIFYFDNNTNISLSLVVFCILILSTIIKFIKYKEILKVPKQNYILILFIFIIFSVLISLTNQLNGAFRILQSLTLLFFFTLIRCNNFKGFLRLIAWNSVIVIVVFTSFFYESILKILLIADRFSFNESIHPNDIAMFYVQLGISSLILFLYHSTLFEKIIAVLGYLISYFFILISGSRTGLITISSIFVFYLIYSNIVLIKKTKLIIIIGLLSISSWVYIESFNLPIIERFSAKEVLDSGGSNRTFLMKTVIEKIIPKNFILGIGIGPENTASAMRMNVGTTSVDNMYVETFAELGLVGFTLFYSYFSYLIYLFFKNRKKMSFLIFPLIVVSTCFVNGIGELIFYEKFFWNGFILGILMINNMKDERFRKYNNL